MHTPEEVVQITQDVYALENTSRALSLTHVEAMATEMLLKAALCNLGSVFEAVTEDLSLAQRQWVADAVLAHVRKTVALR